MKEKKNSLLFNFIAPVYGLFYNFQKNWYASTVDNVKNTIDIYSFDSIIDIGCGTGALSSVLDAGGMNVTGVDTAIKMVNIGKSKAENKNIEFIQGDILKGLPFPDKSFDIAIASYVVHGLKSEQRKQMYAEMNRIAREYVIIHDYNKERSLLTSIIEWLEGGNYFEFIENGESEMKAYFLKVEIINVDVKANWYICKPI